jgi:hypothetical protein
MIKNGEKYLVTSDSWFFGTDGNQYRAAWGVCVVVEFKETFGFVPQRPSTNWLMQIGEGENMVIIAGCQIHHLVKCDSRPILIPGDIAGKDEDPSPKNKIFFTE